MTDGFPSQRASNAESVPCHVKKILNVVQNLVDIFILDLLYSTVYQTPPLNSISLNSLERQCRPQSWWTAVWGNFNVLKGMCQNWLSPYGPCQWRQNSKFGGARQIWYEPFEWLSVAWYCRSALKVVLTKNNKLVTSFKSGRTEDHRTRRRQPRVIGVGNGLGLVRHIVHYHHHHWPMMIKSTSIHQGPDSI